MTYLGPALVALAATIAGAAAVWWWGRRKGRVYFGVKLPNNQGVFEPSIAETADRAWGVTVREFRHNDEKRHDELVAAYRGCGYRLVHLRVTEIGGE